MKINEVIRNKRRELGLTQEQTAEYLGISASAVNKWENGISYPDITLLPSLARLLKTDLNTLLSFRDDLSRQEIGEICNLISGKIDSQGFTEGFEAAMAQIREFPGCDLLIYTLASLLNGAMFLSGQDISAQYEESITRLYRRVMDSADPQIRDGARGMLANQAANRGDFHEAQLLLEGISAPSPINKQQMQASFYIRQGQYEEATALLEQKLLQGATDVYNTLLTLTEIAVKQNRTDDAVFLTDLTAQTAVRYYLMGCCSQIPYLQLALSRQDAGACLQALDAVFCAFQKRWDINATPLYSHIKGKNEEEGFSASLSATLAKQMQSDEEFAFLRELPEFWDIVNKYTPQDG